MGRPDARDAHPQTAPRPDEAGTEPSPVPGKIAHTLMAPPGQCWWASAGAQAKATAAAHRCFVSDVVGSVRSCRWPRPRYRPRASGSRSFPCYRATSSCSTLFIMHGCCSVHVGRFMLPFQVIVTNIKHQYQVFILGSINLHKMMMRYFVSSRKVISKPVFEP